MPQEILVKSLLNKTKRRDPWFLDDYTINPYSACSFNCLYCYIRGSKYGEHMEEKLAVKMNAISVLEKQLKGRAKREQYGIIVLSSATDPYLQVEEKQQLTRKILEVILHHRFPVHVITKSDLVVRDFDLISQINEYAIAPQGLTLKHKAIVTFSFSTLDDATAKIFEPGATPPSQRLATVRQTLSAGFHSGISLMPLLPYISDTPEQLEDMFRTFKELGVHYILPASMTLFGNNPADSKSLILDAIQKHYPQLTTHYEKLFSYGFQTPSWYRTMLAKRATELHGKYDVSNRIM